MTQTKALLAALLLGFGVTAVAHEGSDHAGKSAEAKREQKPWGIAAEATAAHRTIRITMSDQMRFTPDSIDVKQGETIRFVVRNMGNTMHEMVIGTGKELDAHAAMMVKFPAMQHNEAFMAHVAPGQTDELAWTFNRAGEFDFACLVAGHYQAGMVGKIRVKP